MFGKWASTWASSSDEEERGGIDLRVGKQVHMCESRAQRTHGVWRDTFRDCKDVDGKENGESGSDCSGRRKMKGVRMWGFSEGC